MAIHYAQDGHVVTITIDRPEARKSLDIDHFGMLADAWIRFRDDADAYVAILTGVQDVYCVGADLKKFVPIVTERADKLAAGESTLARTSHGAAFVSAIARANVVGVQFHPERSGTDGLRLLANVVDVVRSGAFATGPVLSGRA